VTPVKVLELLVYLAVIIAITPMLGGYMKRVFACEKTFLDGLLRPIEKMTYRLCGVDAETDQGWVEWASTMLIVNAVSLFVLYGFQRLQKFLPLNPNRFGAVSPD
jgi:K+-transporting ATPase ATPase A chain